MLFHIYFHLNLRNILIILMENGHSCLDLTSFCKVGKPCTNECRCWKYKQACDYYYGSVSQARFTNEWDNQALDYGTSLCWELAFEIRGNTGVAPGSWQRQRRIELDCVQYFSVDKSSLGIVSAQGQHVSANQGSPWGSREKSNKAKNRHLVHRHLPSA